jgi:hypothetical protein
MIDDTIGDDGTPTRSEWEEFAALLLGDDFEPPDAGDGLYAGMDEASSWELALRLAVGGAAALGVPDDDLGPPPADHKGGPRRPKPDRSQGRHAPPPPDPAGLFADRVLDRLNYPPARWRDIT